MKFRRSWLCVGVILGVLGLSAADPYCTAYNSSGTATASPDHPLPLLPLAYQTTIEANIVGKNMTLTAREYFDNPGDRATLQILTNNSLHSLVFDYANDQLFYVDDSGSCQISDLQHDDNNILFGDIVIAGVPHVFTTGDALHFSKSFGEQYMGQEQVRGITCDKWRSCLYWPQLKSNFTLDYYFTAKKWSDPVDYPQIPVRAFIQGLRDFGNGKLTNFTHYYDYIDFKPFIAADPSIFETPRGVICPGRKKTKTIPTLPQFFHYRQEISTPGSNDIVLADVWYDSSFRLTRYDYRFAAPVPPLMTTNPITEVHDFNYGVQYVRDQITGRCIASPIANASFDVSQNVTAAQNGSYILNMKDPMKLFFLDNTYAYTGERTVRGLLCDVYTSRRTDYNIPGYPQSESVFEYFFLGDDYEELPDDGATKPKHVPIYLEINIPAIGYNAKYNFLDFDKEHPDTSVFDVSSCFSESAKLQFQVRFPGHYMPGSSGMLKQSAQVIFRNTMNVSPVRVQDLRLDYDNSQIYISATLLDRSPFLAEFSHLAQKEIEMHDDKPIGPSMASNQSQCAQLCVSNTDFTCNSFDFCPMDKTAMCRLSKAHIGDNGINLKNSTCDHFSRTVNGPVVPEVSILEAYASLEQAVYNQGVTLIVFIAGNPNQYTYVAVDTQITFGWLVQKPLPSLAGQFSYHLEITVPKLKEIFDSHIYYDYEYKLVRYDLVNTAPSPPLFTVDPITTIHDYNTGLAYIIDNKEGNCSIGTITNSSFDVNLLNNPGYVVKMKSPLDIFYLNGTYKYAGQRTIRGMLCDVFEDKRTDFKFGPDPLPQESVFQFYFLSDGWNELSEDSGTSVSSQPIALVISSTAGTFTITYNFYDFSEQHPDLSSFDIRKCFTGKQIRHFLIKFKGYYHPTLDTRLKQFQKQAQLVLGDITQASPLRFQDPQITYGGEYTYYLGTMVEQAPYLLDFTRSPGLAIAHDKVYPNVNSDMACASLCRKETSLNCVGFNYCPSSKNCQLSKHRSGAMQISQTCDSYSRTVNSSGPIEPTVDEALVMLKNRVYSTTGIDIAVNNDQDVMVLYKAVLFDADVYRPDSEATTSPNLAHFIPSRNNVQMKTADMQLKGVSVDQCAAACLAQTTFDCMAFVYSFDTGVCQMSHIHPDQNLTTTPTNMNSDLYARTYLDMYSVYPGHTVQTTGDTVIAGGVASAQLCAKKCSNNQAYSCKSFDFCSTTKTCILKSKHILDLPKSAVSSSSVCSHYSKKYVHDFSISKQRSLSVGLTFKFTNVTRDACAKLCVDTGGVGCLAFTYCGTTSTCQLLSASPAQNTAKVTVSTCDLYTRIYFPGQSQPGNRNPIALTSNNNAKSTGFSSGAMAGLAFGMLIPGMVLGAALLYFCRTKKLVQEEQMRMGFVNMNHENVDDDYGNVRTKDTDEEMPPAHLTEYDSPN